MKTKDTVVAKPRVAADDLGDSKQPAMRPIFKKVAPQLVKPFQRALKSVPSNTKKKLLQTYFGKVKLTGDVTSKKNMKLLRDTLVAAVKKDLGWLEFVAEQILDGSVAELGQVLGGGERAASVKTAAFMKPQYWKTTMYTVDTNEGTQVYPKDDFTPEQIAKQEGVSVEDIEESSGWFCRLSAPGYMDATDWGGPFANKQLAMQHIENMYDVDPETGDDLDDATEASVKTADVIGRIYEGHYPTDEGDFDHVTFPVEIKTMGQNDSWYRLDTVARAAGFSDGTTITLDDAADVVSLFEDLYSEADKHSDEMDDDLREAYENEQSGSDEEVDETEFHDENYNEYHADDHEPAAILAGHLGL